MIRLKFIQTIWFSLLTTDEPYAISSLHSSPSLPLFPCLCTSFLSLYRSNDDIYLCFILTRPILTDLMSLSFSPRNQSPRSGNQSPRLIGSPRNSSPRSQPKGEKRFPCPVPLCDAGYARRTVLLRHFSAKHGHLINLYPEMKPDDISCPVPGCNAYVSPSLLLFLLIHYLPCLIIFSSSLFVLYPFRPDTLPNLSHLPS